LYFPLQYLYANVVLLLYIYLTFSLILFKNQQFECIPHPILT
jgi:ABC-type transport system involved in cytochrome c biogenesis permease subunit